MTRLRSQVLTWRKAIAMSGLPRTTRAVAWALANYMNESGESAFPSVKRLCNDVGNERGDGPASQTTVISALRRLEAGGLLERVALGGGRGHRSEWQARLPETVQQVNPSEVSAAAQSDAIREAVTRSLRASEQAPGATPGEQETVQQLHPSGGGESLHSRDETVQLEPAKPPVGEPEVVQEGDKNSSSRITSAAGELLDHLLKELGVGATLRRRAVEDPLRAKAWLELAQSEATTNVAGYFRTGFDSGEWPSTRFGREKPADARKRWCFEYGARLDLADAHAVIEDWRDIDDVDREEMRQWVDEARARRADEERAA